MANSSSIPLDSGGRLSADYLAHALNTFLPEAEKDEFIAACGQPLRASIRVNTLKITVAEFKVWAESIGAELEPVPWCKEGFWVDANQLATITSIGNLPQHIQGLFYIQEASSMLPPEALFNRVDLDSPRVMDMAAAPGSKTTQMAALMNNQGLLLANELSASRLKSLHHNLIRCGVMNSCLSHLDAGKLGQFLPQQFDLVLLDAPCGGEGTVRKDINALADWNQQSVLELAGLQKKLILSAYDSLKAGGRLVYSTCTLSPEENQQVVAHLLQETSARVITLKNLFEGADRAATKEGYLHVLPHIFNSEGFFVAAFEKPESDISDRLPVPRYQSPFLPVAKKQRQLLTQFLSQNFAVELDGLNIKLLQRDKEIWLFPAAIDELNVYIKINRSGFCLAKIYPNKIRVTHEFAVCLGQLANKQTLELNDEQLMAFMRGQNFITGDSQLEAGDVILTYQSKPLGLAQHNQGKLKNNLPRELVKDNYQVGIASTDATSD